MFSDILIKNAKIVSSTKVILGDIIIKDGKIAKLGKFDDIKSEIIVDAQQQYLLPGGIDPHVHFQLKTKAGFNADTFESGSLAALAGGTTTIIDFVTPAANDSLKKALAKRKKEAENIYTDYHLHQSITHWNKNTPYEMQECVEKYGIKSFKTYLAYQDSIGIDWETLERVMTKAAALDALVLVHAEEGKQIDSLVSKYEDSNKSPAIIHMKTHPVSTEVDAIEKLLKICERTNCKTYIVHVSTTEGIRLIQQAKQKGLPVFAETCTQYYLMHDNVYKTKNDLSLLNILSPPLRPIEDRNGISQALTKGYIDCIATDHCPFTKGVKLIPNQKYKDIPHGIGGVQFRNSIFHYQYVFKRLVNWQEMAKLTAENAAMIFGLSKKGKIEEGFDADMVLYQELPKAIKIKALNDFSKSDINVFENQNIQIKVQIVIKAGEIVYREGVFSRNLKQGRFIEV